MRSAAPRKAVNVALPADLLAEARAHDVNLSATLEAALEAELRVKRRAAWLRANEAGIAEYNRDVERQGTFSDGLRSF